MLIFPLILVLAKGVSAEIYQRIPAKSLITFPLIKDGEALGVLTFANTETPFALEAEDIDHIGHYVTYVVSALPKINGVSVS